LPLGKSTVQGKLCVLGCKQFSIVDFRFSIEPRGIVWAVTEEADELVAIMLRSRRTAKKPGRTPNRKSTIENRQLVVPRGGML